MDSPILYIWIARLLITDNSTVPSSPILPSSPISWEKHDTPLIGWINDAGIGSKNGKEKNESVESIKVLIPTLHFILKSYHKELPL